MIYFIVVISLCSYSLCFGAEKAHSNSEMIDFLYRVINFTLMIIILYIVAKKTAIKDFFSLRKEEIKKKFEELQTQKYEFEKKYHELESKLKELEDKKKEIIEQFRMEGLKEREKIIAEAKERAAHIIEQADTAIEREILAAKERLKEEIIDIATHNAKEIISKTIKDKDQNRLIEEFIENMGRMH